MNLFSDMGNSSFDGLASYTSCILFFICLNQGKCTWEGIVSEVEVTHLTKV